MAGPLPAFAPPPVPAARQPSTLREPRWARALLIGITVTFLGVLLVAPLVLIFAQAFSRGLAVYLAAFADPAATAAIRLTLLAAAVAVPLNVFFGIVAAWAIGKFEFRGRGLLVSAIDVPFAISPVVAGFVFILVFGVQGWLGPWLDARDVRVIFAVPGILLATLFVTMPFVARELIHLVEAHGTSEEEAARLMGAGGLTILWRVTLPNARWALFYGIILCNARAMGEFGAVSVVSGHIRGRTNTLPLHVEILYNEYNFAAAFAAASLLTLLAVVTLVLKAVAERRMAHHGHGH